MCTKTVFEEVLIYVDEYMYHNAIHDGNEEFILANAKNGQILKIVRWCNSSVIGSRQQEYIK